MQRMPETSVSARSHAPYQDNATFAASKSSVSTTTVGSVDTAITDRYLAAHGITLEEPLLDHLGRMPEQAVHEDVSAFHALVQTGLENWHIPAVSRYPLWNALGRFGMTKRLLLSNAMIRERAGIGMIDKVGSYWKTTRRTPGRRWWFVTIISDEGNALEYAPVVDLTGLRQTAYNLLLDADLSAVGAIEIQALANFPQGGMGRSFMFHCHAICWTDNPLFDANAVEHRVCDTGPLRHWLGARTVRFTPIKDSHREITWKAYYLLKAPLMAKYMARSQKTPSGFALNDSIIRKDLALRLVECLSQLEFSEMVFGVGDGVAVRDDWLSKLRCWHRGLIAQSPGIMNDYDMAAIWADLWQRRRRIPRQPFNIVGDPTQRPTEWERAAQNYLEKVPATRRY